MFCLNIINAQSENYIDYYLKLIEISDFRKQCIANKDTVDLYNRIDSIYQVAFNMVSYAHPENYISAAINACKMDSLGKSKDYLLKAALCGYPLSEMKFHKALKPLMKSNYWKEFKKEYNVQRNKYIATLDKKLVTRINNMYLLDQKYRQYSNRKWQKYKYKQREIDSLNLLEIQKMQQEYGKIPGIKEVGYEGMMLLCTMFRHVETNYTIDTLGPQIIKQSRNGDYLPHMGPGIMDYKYMNQVEGKGKHMTKQKYGTQYLRTSKTKTLVIIPVQDIKNVNKLRKEVGLYPLDETKLLQDEDLVRKECDYFEF